MLKHKRILSFFAVFILCCAPTSLFAQAPEQVQKQPAPKQKVVTDLPIKIQQKWSEVKAILDEDNYVDAGIALQQLVKMKNQAGFDSLELVSLQLLERASVAYATGNADNAAFLVRQALKISPSSTLVWFHSIGLARSTGVGTTSDHLKAVLHLVTQEPHLMLRTATELVYPVLWALTIGLYLTFIACFVVRIREFTEAVSRRVPLRVRGIFGPLLALGLIVLPCLFGPLWALAGWSVVLFVYLPRYRWVGVVCGALIALWGYCIPLRENITQWFEEPGTEVLLRVATGSFLPSDKETLTSLTYQRSQDGVLHYTLGDLLQKYGDFSGAAASFEKAEQFLGEQPWTKAQLGNIAFVQGDSEKAAELYKEAEELGISSAAFYFNYSKIEFDLLHTEVARELFLLARSKNDRLVKTLEKREDELGMHSQHALAGITLPTKVLLSSALQPLPRTAMREQRLVNELMPGMKGLHLLYTGLGIFFVFLLFGGRERRSRLQTYFPDYQHPGILSATLRILPGGSWVLSGRTVIGFLIASFSVLLVMPVVGWPVALSDFLESFPGAYRVYSGCVALILFMLLFVGTQLEEEKA